MKHLTRFLGGLCVALMLPATALATNGMFLIGHTAKSVAMGGATIALPQDAMAGATNPAAIIELGPRADMDASVFVPRAQARLGSITAESHGDLYLMPAMGLVMPIDYETVMGFSAVGAGGGGSRYNSNFYDLNSGTPGVPTGLPNTGNLGVLLMVMQMNPTLAQRINDNHTVGASVILGMQQFRATGLGNFTTFTTSQNATNLTDRGSEFTYGWGLRLGWLGKYEKQGLTLGAVYTTKTYMRPFDHYKELFAESGDIDTPGSASVGAALKLNPKTTVALDIVRYYYEKVRSIANLGPNLPGPAGLFPTSKAENGLGETAGLGFGWSDQTVYKLGIQYEHNSKWTYRAGWNYGKSPINEDREIAFNIVAPATTQHHATAGFSYKLDKHHELSASYMHAFTFSQSGPTYIGTSGTIKMMQNAVNIGIGFTF
jgi:long-chain fatty acid transport protein